MSQHMSTHRRILGILNDYLGFALNINKDPGIQGVSLAGKVCGSFWFLSTVYSILNFLF